VKNDGRLFLVKSDISISLVGIDGRLFLVKSDFVLLGEEWWQTLLGEEWFGPSWRRMESPRWRWY